MVATLPALVAAPVTDDVAIARDDQRLGNNVTTTHKRLGCLTIRPTQAKTEIEIAHKLLHAFACPRRIFGSQTNELDRLACVFFPHLLVIRNFGPAGTAPG